MSFVFPRWKRVANSLSCTVSITVSGGKKRGGETEFTLRERTDREGKTVHSLLESVEGEGKRTGGRGIGREWFLSRKGNTVVFQM